MGGEILTVFNKNFNEFQKGLTNRQDITFHLLLPDSYDQYGNFIASYNANKIVFTKSTLDHILFIHELIGYVMAAKNIF